MHSSSAPKHRFDPAETPARRLHRVHLHLWRIAFKAFAILASGMLSLKGRNSVLLV
jgi:hypothetical protein